MSGERLSNQWEGYDPWVQAILDEYARAIRALEEIVLTIDQERYLAGSELADEEFPNMRAIMQHVAGAANRYVDYLETALRGTDVSQREHEFAYDSPATVIPSLWAAFERTVAVLGLTMGRSDEELAKLDILTRWGQHYDIEQMLEHAIVHILRHRRQIERWLAAMK
jgi:hypothetical protein